MNTDAALATLLDATIPHDERRDLFFDLLNSDSPELDKPLLVASIIKSGTHDLFRSTVIVNSPSAPSPEIASILRSIVLDPTRPSAYRISLMALTKIEQLDAIPLLRTLLDGEEDYLRSAAVTAIWHLPPDVGNKMFREIVGDPAKEEYFNDDQFSAAYHLAQRGDDLGRDILWGTVECGYANRYQVVTAYCGLVYLRDQDGIRRLIEWLRSDSPLEGEDEDEIDRKFRFTMLKQLCGFQHEDEFMDCTVAAIEHLKRLLVEPTGQEETRD